MAGRRAVVERGRGDVAAGADRRARHDGLGGVRVKVSVRVRVRVRVKVRVRVRVRVRVGVKGAAEELL